MIVAFASYYFPKQFIERDAEHVHQVFESEIAQQNERARELWQQLFNEKLEESVQLTEATLAYIGGQTDLVQELQEHPEEAGKKIVQMEPWVDFLQVGEKSWVEGKWYAQGFVEKKGLKLIDSPLLSKYYLVNGVEIGAVYVALGQSFFSGIETVSGAMILFVGKEGEFEHVISKDTVESSFFKGLSLGRQGTVDIQGKHYSYFELSSPIAIPVKAFVLIPDTSEPLYRMQQAINASIAGVYDKLTYQLLVTVLFVLAVALLLLSFLSKRMTKPITQLAVATKKVTSGQYADVKLPKVKKSEDEISLLTHNFSEMIQGLQDREKIRNLLDKVVSKEIASEILKGNVNLGGEMKEVTILFVDIRGFTAMTAEVDPQIVITRLNQYMTAMTKIIETEGGVIDKYIGDAIMALYGAPVVMPDGAKKAIVTALEMVQKVKEWNKTREKPFYIGIGIHTGPVVAGNMGAETRLNYTVVGANVNLASRLCSSAAPMEIRVSEATLKASGLEKELLVKPLEPIVYKGFSKPVVTYAVESRLH